MTGRYRPMKISLIYDTLRWWEARVIAPNCGEFRVQRVKAIIKALSEVKS